MLINYPLRHCERSEAISKETKLMSWPFSIRNVLYPKERYIWAPVRIIHETDKAILADNGRKIWIPKSRIYGIRLRKKSFEIYVKKSIVG